MHATLFAAFLVERGIGSISLSADAVVRTRLRVHDAEQAPLAVSAREG